MFKLFQTNLYKTHSLDIWQIFFQKFSTHCIWIQKYSFTFFGAKIGKQVHIYSSTVIWFPWNLEIGDWSAIGEDTLIYNLGRVVIGKKATISHRTHICAGTHDYTNPTLPLLRPEIHIGDQAWICANAFIGPNTHIGEGAIIGAGTVLMKDAEAWGIYAGNPAKYIKKRILS